MQEALATAGMSDFADDVEVRLNRATEAAAPEAHEVFVQAVREMTLADVRRIYEGPEQRRATSRKP